MSTAVSAYTHVIDDPSVPDDTAEDVHARGRFARFFATDAEANAALREGWAVSVVHFDLPAGCEFVAVDPGGTLLARGADLNLVLSSAKGPEMTQIFIASAAFNGSVIPLARFAIAVSVPATERHAA